MRLYRDEENDDSIGDYLLRITVLDTNLIEFTPVHKGDAFLHIYSTLKIRFNAGCHTPITVSNVDWLQSSDRKRGQLHFTRHLGRFFLF